MSTLLKHATPSLNSDEQALESWRANRVQSTRRAAGGSLWLTSQRLIFAPNRIEQKTGGEAWEIPVDDLVSADEVAPQITRVFAGGMSSRLRVTTPQGEELFVLNDVDGVRQRLARLAAHDPHETA